MRSMGGSYIRAAIKLLFRQKYPAALYTHLQDLSVVRPRIVGAAFHSLINCSRYALMAAESIPQNVDARKISISETPSEWIVQEI